MCKLKDHWKSIFDAGAPSPVYVESAIDTMLSQAEALVARYFTKEGTFFPFPALQSTVLMCYAAPPPNFEPDKERVIMWSILDFIHILHRHRLELAPQDPLRLDMCLASASKCVDEIELLAETGPLPIMQDTGSCMTSSLIVFFRKGSRAVPLHSFDLHQIGDTRILRMRLTPANRCFASAQEAKRHSLSRSSNVSSSAIRASRTGTTIWPRPMWRVSRGVYWVLLAKNHVRRHHGCLISPSATSTPAPTRTVMAMATRRQRAISWLSWYARISTNKERSVRLLIHILQEQFLQMPDNVVQNELKDQEYWSVPAFLLLQIPPGDVQLY